MNMADSVEEAKKQSAVECIHTKNLPELLRALKASLFVTTYQAQRLLVCSARTPERVSVLMRVFPRPTGMHVDQERLILCCKNQIWTFYPVFGLGDLGESGGPYDFSFCPREAHVTGDVSAHQVNYIDGEIRFVNTRFSCVCRLTSDASFAPIWKPSWITEITPEDRTHLNGFCYEDGKMKYLTALGRSNEEEGWRENKATGGVLLDGESSEVITPDLSMPHSPRLYDGRLWVLESGKGRLITIDEKSGEVTEVAEFPGFLRGIDFHDRFAFIGLCRIRQDKIFRGLPIEEKGLDLKCGVWVLDIKTGQQVGFVEFTRGVEELFDVGVFRGAINPHVVGFEGDLIDQVMVLPT